MNRPPFLNFFENSSDLVALLVPYLYLGSLSVCHILYWGKLKVLFAIELRSIEGLLVLQFLHVCFNTTVLWSQSLKIYS